MNRLRTAPGEESQQLVSSQQTSKTTKEIGDDDIFLDDESNDDHQAHIRRRAPTRHSIKSLSGRKTASKQTATTGTTTTSAATTTEHRICLDPTTRRQYSYSQSSVLSEGINVDQMDITTTYHPLKKQVQQHQLTVESPHAYNYRSRTNSNIIERRFSNVEAPPIIPEIICE
ncbi:unnamed protein product [Adineta ricciae]|uniref:Uncharacterized protein n=1 Tax=Adineta ricciae TaxID=249248 RepID=A0A813SW74_ADIRI|nr:unnamed protein product [Adineta ricciae]